METGSGFQMPNPRFPEKNFQQKVLMAVQKSRSPKPVPPPSTQPGVQAKPTPVARSAAAVPPTASPLPAQPGDVPVGIAVSVGTGESGTVTARRAGGLRDMSLEVNPPKSA